MATTSGASPCSNATGASSGVLYGHVRFTPDLAHFLFRFRRHTSYMAVVKGVR